MNAKRMLLGLLPWFLFGVVVQYGGAHLAGYAALAAVVLAVVLSVTGGRKFTILNAAGVVTFLVLGVAALAGPATIGDDVAHYGRGIASLVLAATMLGSLAFTPFTEQFARQSVPEQYWHSPVFRAVNRRISAGWGAAVLVIAGASLAYGALAAHGHATRQDRLLLTLAIPAALILAALAWTRRVATEGRTAPAPGAPTR